MANGEHLSILEQGIDVWNKWRNNNLHIRPDFSNADFRQAKLCQANLSYANLSQTSIIQADLSDAT